MLKIFTSIILLVFFGCSAQPPVEIKYMLSDAPIIPKPLNVIDEPGYLQLSSELRVEFEEEEDSFLKNQAISTWEQAVKVNNSEGFTILNFKRSTADMEEEAYELIVDEDGLTIISNTTTGWHKGLQTLRQLLFTTDGELILPNGKITDQPIYEHRGMMLDISRHFFPPEDIKKVIDYLELYKINRLHLHLSDDQGWRIEIKSWPQLTTIGGSTEVGGGEGGFLTQEEFQDLIEYAAQRNIMIIPEIDMPGHTNAALASYPELNCDGKSPELYTGIKVGFSSLCVDKPVTYQFADDVIREISAISPAPFIHIGGDESKATDPEAYIKFIGKVKGIVESHGKQMIGWDEIARGNINEADIVQLWAHPELGEMAVSKGAKIIFSPAAKAYLDMKYDSTTELGLKWAGFIDVEKGYSWDPKEVLDISEEHILGVEAPLWTETVTNMDELEFMLFPRLPGYAEIGWTPTSKREWQDYKLRLGSHQRIFDHFQIDYFKSKEITWKE